MEIFTRPEFTVCYYFGIHPSGVIRQFKRVKEVFEYPEFTIVGELIFTTENAGVYRSTYYNYEVILNDRQGKTYQIIRNGFQIQKIEFIYAYPAIPTLPYGLHIYYTTIENKVLDKWFPQRLSNFSFVELFNFLDNIK